MENKLFLLAIENDHRKRNLLRSLIQSESSDFDLQFFDDEADFIKGVFNKKPDLILVDYFIKESWVSFISAFKKNDIFIPVILYSEQEGFPSDREKIVPGIWDIISLNDHQRFQVILTNFLRLKNTGTFLLSEQTYSRIRKKYRKLIIENGSEGFLIIQDGILKYFDPQIINFLKESEKEITNTPFIEYIHPDDRKKVAERYKKRISGETFSEKVSFRIVSKSGELIWLEIIGYSIDWNGKPAVFYFVWEVTEKIQYQKTLIESEAKYKGVVHSSPNGIIIFDSHGHISEVNAAISSITGYDEEFFIGKSIEEMNMLKEEVRVLGKSTLNDVFSGKIENLEPFTLNILRVDGEPRSLKVGLVLIDSEMGDRKLLMTCSDITDYKRAVSDLVESEKKFRELHEKMLESVIATDFDGNIVEFNKAFMDLTGFGEGELLRKNLFHMFPEGWASEDAKRRNDIVQKKGFSETFEAELTTLSKGLIPVEVQSYLKDDGPDSLMGYWYFIKDISLKKKYENELIEREIQLQSMLEYLPFPIIREDLSRVKKCIDRYWKNSGDPIKTYFDKFPEKLKECCKNAKISYCNQSALKFFNVKDISELEPLYVCSKQEGMLSARGRMVKGFLDFNVVFEEEVSFNDSGGEEKIAMFKSAILPGREDIWDIVLVALIDLTERVYLDNQVKVLLQAISHSPASIIITDTKGKIEYVNPKFTEITGYTFEEAYGNDPSILKSGKMPEEVYEKLWKTITSGGEWTGELLNKNKKGELYWVLASISAVKNDKGKVTHFVAIKEDITEQKETEQKLRDAKQKAEESDTLKTAFLANMSHEIRTPMNAIVGFSELLRTSNVQGRERDEYFNIINTSCKTLSNLIDDIIDLAKIESGQTKIVEEACQPAVIMKELQMYYSEEIQKSGKNLKLILDFDFSKDLVIKTDEFRLRQILTNLLGNAFKFTDEGMIAWGGRVNANDEMEFFVKDTGIGMKKDHLDTIFERFRQLDGSSVRKYESTGLGLSVSRSLVELLGGHIWVESESGKGSEFRFTIAFRPVSGNNFLSEAENNKRKDLFDWKDKNILVVEDNISNFEFIKAVLSKTKVNILWTDNGKSALEMFKKNDNIHLVLMDIQIPEMDGYETTREIKKIKPDVPVIAQTAFAMSRDKEKSIQAGCNDYISKPIKPLDLLNLMEKYISVI